MLPEPRPLSRGAEESARKNTRKEDKFTAFHSHGGLKDR